MILDKPIPVNSGKSTALSMRKDHSQQVMCQEIPGIKEQAVKLYINFFYNIQSLKPYITSLSKNWKDEP